jgi:hypothetical protein
MKIAAIEGAQHPGGIAMPMTHAFLRMRFDSAHQLLFSLEQSLYPTQAEPDSDPEVKRLALKLHRSRLRLERLLLAVESGCSATFQAPTE